MGIKEIIDKLKGINKEDELDSNEPKPYEVDRYLESLRIERQRQMEEQEKVILKKKIGEYKRKRVREHMFGIKDKVEKKQRYLDVRNKKRKKCNILKNHSKFL